MNFLEILGKDIINPSQPWSFKYRPTTLDQVIGNPSIIQTLKYYLQNKNIPNLILTGPNGVGKETTIRALVSEYLREYREEASLVLHGSINRGKDVVSEKLEYKKNDKTYMGPNIINFIKRRLSLPADLCRLIVIYDFDQMTKEAQMALRRIIELYSHKVRFIFACNNISNIIEAIQSRCVILKYTKIDDSDIKTVLGEILDKEEKHIDDDIIDLICLTTYGDLKQSINYLQIICFADVPDKTTFYNIFNMPSLNTVQSFLSQCIMGDERLAYNSIQGLLDQGFNVHDILDVLLKIITFNQIAEMPPDTGNLIDGKLLRSDIQVALLKALNHCFFLVECTNSPTHLYFLISQFIAIFHSDYRATQFDRL